MATRVSLVDTSILCNLLPILGRNQDEHAVKREMLEKQEAGETLILPVAAIVESGNFIAQLSSGRIRKTAAEKFSAMLRMVASGTAPWTLHTFPWDDIFLQLLLAGADTGSDIVRHAVNKVGAGDLCILAERKIYADRTKINNVSIWTKDAALLAYS